MACSWLNSETWGSQISNQALCNWRAYSIVGRYVRVGWTRESEEVEERKAMGLWVPLDCRPSDALFALLSDAPCFFLGYDTYSILS